MCDVPLSPSRMAADSTETGETVWQHPFEEHQDLEKQADAEGPADASTGQGHGDDGRRARQKEGAKREGEVGDQCSRREEGTDSPEEMSEAGTSRTSLRKRKSALRD